MLAIFMTTFREGLEALLIISIAMAFLRKTDNALLLRPLFSGAITAVAGSAALGVYLARTGALSQGLTAADLPATAVQVVSTTDRAAVGELITMPDYVDVIVPRGGKSLIERVSKEARVPVIKHLDGNCHVFIDREANLSKAIIIAVNAKTHRYGVCNAMETLLVDAPIAEEALPQLAALYGDKGVELRGCMRTAATVSYTHLTLPTSDLV